MKATRERLEERLKERMDYQQTLSWRKQTISKQLDGVGVQIRELEGQIAATKPQPTLQEITEEWGA